MRRKGRFSGPTTPRAIDPASGFQVPLDRLVKQWDGEMIYDRFVDKRQNPQDFVTGVPDNSALPFSRPEPPDRFMSVALVHEDGYSPILLEDGSGAVMSEGEAVNW